MIYSILFDEVVRVIIEEVGDSTHVRSNMAVLLRLELFTHTLTA